MAETTAGFVSTAARVSALVTIMAGTAGAQPIAPAFDVVEIPTLPGLPITQSSGMNDHGHAVGGNWSCPFILSCPGRAFLYDGRSVHDFTAGLVDNLPAGQIGVTRGVDINGDGDVVFWLTIIDVGVFAYLYDDGEEYIEIEGPGSVPATAWALNESGVVAAAFTTPGGDARAFTWSADAGVLEVIDPPAGFTSSMARDINDTGTVIGGVSNAGGSSRGFSASDGVVTLLEPLPGAARSEASAVNAHGLVAGVSIDAGGHESLVVWEDGEIVDSVTLDLGMVWFDVHAVNDHGVVVGSYWPLEHAAQPFAFRWRPGRPFEQLDELSLSIPNLNLWEASGVNASGQIVAWGEHPGFVSGAFLLTPVPIPGDLDGDGAVSVSDLILLFASWGVCAEPDDCPGDLDGDGAVGVPDLIILIGHWG